MHAKGSIRFHRMLFYWAEILPVFAYTRRGLYALTGKVTATQFQLRLPKAQTMTKQELENSGSSNPLSTPMIGSSMTIGFASATWMWVLAWILHLPGMSVPNAIAIPVLMLPLLVVGTKWISAVSPDRRIKVGVLSGLIAGLINLLILGSHIVEQPESTAEMGEQANTLAPNALVVILGSIGVSIGVGLVAGVLSGMIASKKDSSTQNGSISASSAWNSKLAWVTAMTYLPLIAVGGAVTSTDSGLAVPDAVTSYGAISVLFPLKLMAEPRIFLEHSHRLFGTLAGLTTLVFMIRILMGEPRKLPRLLSIVLFVSVCVQGYMGIIRVAESSTFFAIIHGVFAQLVFALAAACAIILSQSWIGSNPSQETNEAAKKARTILVITFACLCIQLILGAVTRHLNSSHAMMSHMGFAFIVMMLVIVGGALCMRTAKAHESGKPIRIFGGILHGLIVIQFTLGFAVLGLAWEGDDAPELPTSDELLLAAPIETVPALITTTHHVIGALILATAAGALFWSFKLASRSKIM
jgi:heme a synthase